MPKNAIAKISEQSDLRQKKQNNPQIKRTQVHILNSTRELLATNGYRNITVGAVSVHSGSSRSTIYRYWPKIDDLLFDAFSKLIGEPFPSPDTGDFKKDLLCINQLYIDAILHSKWIKILPSFIEASQNDTHCAELLALLVDNSRSSSLAILKNAQEREQLPKTVNLEWLVDVISGSITYRFLLTDKPVDEAGYLEYLIDSAIAGVC